MNAAVATPPTDPDAAAPAPAGTVLSVRGAVVDVGFAGIGEHAPTIRAAVCARLAWMGLRLDSAANAAGGACISTADSRVEVRVIATDEEAMIARHTQAVVRSAAA